MDKAIYIAMTGAKHNLLAQGVNANNLANVNTDGFRADLEASRAMPVYYGDGHPTRAYAMTEVEATDFTPGPLKETGNDLDIAIKGEGWIAVQAPNGEEAYVRTGSLYIDSVGMLRTGAGLPVLGNGGPIALPPLEKIEIGDDGTVTIREAGAAPNVLATVDRIKLVNIPVDELKKAESGLIVTKSGIPQTPDPDVRIVSGFLEASNVNAVAAMTEMLSLSRQYEMQVKVMSSADENGQTAMRLLRITA
jgi:flagellar basal-body rod protein FlgF